MRLLDTWTGQFAEKDPRNPETVYAILSHTWDAMEQTYQELRDIQKRYVQELLPPNSKDWARGGNSAAPSSVKRCPRNVAWAPPSSISTVSGVKTATLVDPPSQLNCIWGDPELSPKIREACKIAREYSHRYIWIDSCCIDKTSSSKLSEAINSMYQWYSRAAICFAFLADVPDGADHEAKDSEFRGSRWFTRGWTLQELIAPLQVVFLSMTWTRIGSKHSFAYLVNDITNISDTALLHVAPLHTFSVAQRLSWAAMRETTRVEDRAYSLLGIFDINMPTLYGEGNRAFRRLQEEILRRIPDQTLFAWTAHGMPEYLETARRAFNASKLRRIEYSSLFAFSPEHLNHCGGITPISPQEVVRRLRPLHHLRLPTTDYNPTPHGIRTHLPVIPLSVYFSISGRSIHLSNYLYLVILQCEHKDYPGHLLARLYCTPTFSYDSSTVQSLFNPTFSDYCGAFELLLLSPERLTRLRWHPKPVDIKTFYIPHGDGPNTGLGRSLSPRNESHETINLILLKTTHDALYSHGYMAKLHGPESDHPATHWLTLSSKSHTITIKYRYTFRITLSGSQQLTMKAYWSVETSESLLETNPSNPHEAVQDSSGTLYWTDSQPWEAALSGGPQSVQLPADILGMEGWWMDHKLTFARRNCYTLHIEIRNEASKGAPISAAGLRLRMQRCKDWVEKLATRAVSRITHART